MLSIICVAMMSSCNDCRKLNCQNDSYCQQGECFCGKWYSGEDCSLFFTRNYSGKYYGNIDSANRSFADTLRIDADTEIPNRLILETGVYAEFENDSQLIIPTQLYTKQSDTIPVIGFGQIRNEILTIQYSNQYEATRNILFHFEGKRV
ncbi:MAG: hypothetical protein NWR30_01975, partial [Salibacteraceae bacterium]|nr:hypothetical protein [Salibacteraceae bacterium]